MIRGKPFSKKPEFMARVEKAVFRDSCFACRSLPLGQAAGRQAIRKNPWAAAALPGNAGGPLNLPFVRATDQASRDMRHGSSFLMLSRPSRKKRLKPFSTKNPVLRASCFVTRKPDSP